MEKVIKVIEDRITYYSSGDEWKSLNEIIADRKVVKVLESLKEEINIFNQ
tara:strand:+ start:1530 stop:1679 length:150 start_codon:yes stop_codon:yes gene_type:complete